MLSIFTIIAVAPRDGMRGGDVEPNDHPSEGMRGGDVEPNDQSTGEDEPDVPGRAWHLNTVI